MILKEGGNVFKNEEGAITQRIATTDVKPTVDWINQTFGFDFIDDDMLGTTGQKEDPDGSFEKNSSGDLDLNTDTTKVSKEEIINKLVTWCKKQNIPDLEIMNKGRTFTQGWVANAGLQIHFRTPIRGNPDNGDAVVANDWGEIAPILLGPGATEKDTYTVESMIEFLRNDPNFDELIAPWLETMQKQGKGLPESYQTLEDKHLSRIKELSGMLLNSTRML